MSATPRLAVCIPAYNQPDLLGQTLASLCDQGLAREDYVVVVSDDASPEPLGHVVERFASRLQLVYQRSEVNRGHIANWDAAWQIVETPHVAFLAHDDLVAPGQLGRAMSVVHGNPETVLVASLALCQRHPGSIDTRMHGMFIRGQHARYDDVYRWDPAEWFALALISTPLSVTGAVFRADVFRRCRQWLSFPLWHDRLMLAEMGLHGPVASLPWIGGYYRVREDQLSAQLMAAHATEFRAATEAVLRFASSQQIPVIDFWIDYLVEAPEHERSTYLRLLETALPADRFSALRTACERRLGRRLPLTRLERLRVPRAIAALVRDLDRALAGRSH